MSNLKSELNSISVETASKLYPDDLTKMTESAKSASALLKAMSHEGRLLILCYLSDGEKAVGELEARLGVRQAAVSQQLARLRQDGLVKTRRDGKSIFYSIADPNAAAIMETLYSRFCAR